MQTFMLKQIAALLFAGIFLLTTPAAAQPDEDFSDEPTVNEPFAKPPVNEPQPLADDEKTAQPPDNNSSPADEPQPIQAPPVDRPKPIDEAIVTSGGVDVKEIDPRTMQSKIVDGLFIVGEVADIDGFTGGFNLQAAWSTGFVAGTSATATVTGRHG